MIRVPLAKEPGRFDRCVRVPGSEFLSATPRPSTRDFKNRAYWRRSLSDLYDLYDGICAYSCHRIARDIGAPTVDHFVPKKVAPRLAYEWDNLRLVCGRLNGRKGIHQDVLDPCQLRNGVFVILFPGLQVVTAGGLPEDVRRKACSTVSRLGLNDAICMSSRMEYVMEYCRGRFDGGYMQRNAPFLFREITRQGGVRKISVIMGVAQRE